MNVGEKVMIAKQLAKLGVDVIEAGFAYSSPGDFEAIKTIGGEVEGPIICSLARAKEEDIRSAWEALKDATEEKDTYISFHLRYPPEISVPCEQGGGAEAVCRNG